MGGTVIMSLWHKRKDSGDFSLYWVTKIDENRSVKIFILSHARDILMQTMTGLLDNMKMLFWFSSFSF